MVGSSILPVAIHKNKLYFLFGKENSLADTPGWSDFGGGVNKGENIYDTALREGGEELTGFLGDGNEIKKIIKKNGGTYKMVHNTYNMHIFYIDYDENLPKYYNNNHKYLWKRMNKKMLNDTMLFEKIEIEWFCEDELKKRKHEFRNFYQEIVENIINDIKNIKKFILKRKLRVQTRRKKSHNRRTQKK